MGADQPLGAAFNQVRTDLIDSHKQALEYITRSEERTRDRALLVSGVLGLMGLVVLVLGFITAHNIARRFGQPIEPWPRRPTSSAKATSMSPCR